MKVGKYSTTTVSRIFALKLEHMGMYFVYPPYFKLYHTGNTIQDMIICGLDRLTTQWYGMKFSKITLFAGKSFIVKVIKWWNELILKVEKTQPLCIFYLPVGLELFAAIKNFVSLTKLGSHEHGLHAPVVVAITVLNTIHIIFIVVFILYPKWW